MGDGPGHGCGMDTVELLRLRYDRACSSNVRKCVLSPQHPNLLYDFAHVPVPLWLKFCIYKLRSFLWLRAWALSLDRHGFRFRLFQLLIVCDFGKVLDYLSLSFFLA